ncbi:MAG: hypothetical protein HC872_00620 [Gammaproteobacteria bacterium]|nr:hypothetical protein [Gammaproteobacteria bacterium]
MAPHEFVETSVGHHAGGDNQFGGPLLRAAGGFVEDGSRTGVLALSPSRCPAKAFSITKSGARTSTA